MARVTVLGGCGAVGSVAVRTLARQPDFDEVVIGDLNTGRAAQMAAELGDRVSAVGCDAQDASSVVEAIRGSSVILNCVGPFYATVKPILAAVIQSGIDYVDICDDVDVTLDILALDEEARAAGISAIIGMGSSPGVTNLLARLAADVLLDSVDSIDIFHTHGGEPVEGEGVIAHRFHCMSIPIPMYLDGELRYVDFFGPEGIALRERFDFPVIGETLLYPYPHPEQVTIPRHIALRRVTNKGSVLPEEYYDLTRDLCRLGLASQEPLEVHGQRVSPHDFAIRYIKRERERILARTGFGGQRGCISVVARGVEDGEPCEYRFHMASSTQALGEGTGIPAALGAILMQRGRVRRKGVMPPEAAIIPAEFLALVPEAIAGAGGGEAGAFSGFLVERIDAQGNKTQVPL